MHNGIYAVLSCSGCNCAFIGHYHGGLPHSIIQVSQNVPPAASTSIEFCGFAKNSIGNIFPPTVIISACLGERQEQDFSHIFFS